MKPQCTFLWTNFSLFFIIHYFKVLKDNKFFFRIFDWKRLTEGVLLVRPMMNQIRGAYTPYIYTPDENISAPPLKMESVYETELSLIWIIISYYLVRVFPYCNSPLLESTRLPQQEMKGMISLKPSVNNKKIILNIKWDIHLKGTLICVINTSIYNIQGGQGKVYAWVCSLNQPINWFFSVIFFYSIYRQIIIF